MKFEAHTEKVSGTSFHKQDLSRFGLKGKKVPSRVFEGLIIPEPTNPYDENAKAVNVMLPIGGGACEMIKVGYLKKDGWLYNRVKVCRHKFISCRVKVQDFSQLNLNDSYTVIVGQ